jgi:acylphosphatase
LFDVAPERKRLEATVHGLVQGVGYRWHTRQMARRLNLSGYVRNQSDGTVKVVAQGQEQALREFLAHLKEGPSAAVVKWVDARWLSASATFSGFEVRF